MKKLLLITTLIGCMSVGMGQTKIGNITISDSLAKAYFLDCYNKPDTIPTKSSADFSCTNCTRPFAEFDRAKVQADDYNASLIRSSLGKGYRTVHYKAHIDTSYEWLSIYGTGKPAHGKIDKIENIPAGSYQEERGYLVPRKPTETDFIKWLNRKTKTATK